MSKEGVLLQSGGVDTTSMPNDWLALLRVDYEALRAEAKVKDETPAHMTSKVGKLEEGFGQSFSCAPLSSMCWNSQRSVLFGESDTDGSALTSPQTLESTPLPLDSKPTDVDETEQPAHSERRRQLPNTLRRRIRRQRAAEYKKQAAAYLSNWAPDAMTEPASHGAQEPSPHDLSSGPSSSAERRRLRNQCTGTKTPLGGSVQREGTMGRSVRYAASVDGPLVL